MDIAHANNLVAQFLCDAREGDYPHLVDAADVFGEGPTDAELAYLVAEGLNIPLSEAIDRLESVDVVALRQEVLP